VLFVFLISILCADLSMASLVACGFPCLVSCPRIGAIFWRFVQSVSKSIFCHSGFSFGSVSAALWCLDFLQAQSPPADLFFVTDFPLSFRVTA
jgi:hypothetical protein